jgi:hypothetical protein
VLTYVTLPETINPFANCAFPPKVKFVRVVLEFGIIPSLVVRETPAFKEVFSPVEAI